MKFMNLYCLIMVMLFTGYVKAESTKDNVIDQKNCSCAAECQSSFDQELEFDQILDQMAKDGTIAIKPVSTGQVWLRSIGSALFVKYIALRVMLQSWWKYLRYGNSPEHVS